MINTWLKAWRSVFLTPILIAVGLSWLVVAVLGFLTLGQTWKMSPMFERAFTRVGQVVFWWDKETQEGT